jgi:hypothetical protein
LCDEWGNFAGYCRAAWPREDPTKPRVFSPREGHTQGIVEQMLRWLLEKE